MVVTVVALQPITGMAQNSVVEIQRLATLNPKPFVLVEATVGNTVSRAQGVVISPHGHVLTAGHVTFASADKVFSDKFRISLRGRGNVFPEGFVHVHKTLFADREGAEFLEYFYDSELIRNKDSRFFAEADLAVLKLKAKGEMPTLDFFSRERPTIELGETLHLCHYNFPHQPADPTFLISPVKIVGVAETSSGLQYLGEGYYRVGSSGGALLKNGRLIGIQSAAYTINAKDVGEIPLGLISFSLVWRELFNDVLARTPPGVGKAEQGVPAECLLPRPDSPCSSPCRICWKRSSMSHRKTFPKRSYALPWETLTKGSSSSRCVFRMESSPCGFPFRTEEIPVHSQHIISAMPTEATVPAALPPGGGHTRSFFYRFPVAGPP
ncbi:MAG: serine protease [Planctomycetota bacterium]|nr:serine protease [Planctomycetota bacterium]